MRELKPGEVVWVLKEPAPDLEIQDSEARLTKGPVWFDQARAPGPRDGCVEVSVDLLRQLEESLAERYHSEHPLLMAVRDLLPPPDPRAWIRNEVEKWAVGTDYHPKSPRISELADALCARAEREMRRE